jgi:hypothetical protein
MLSVPAAAPGESPRAFLYRADWAHLRRFVGEPRDIEVEIDGIGELVNPVRRGE